MSDAHWRREEEEEEEAYTTNLGRVFPSLEDRLPIPPPRSTAKLANMLAQQSPSTFSFLHSNL
jgi:hypothetical protein